MKEIIARIKQGLPEGSSLKPKTIFNWFIHGIKEEYSVRMANKYEHYSINKPCGAKTKYMHHCDFIEKPGFYNCGNCEMYK